MTSLPFQATLPQFIKLSVQNYSGFSGLIKSLCFLFIVISLGVSAPAWSQSDVVEREPAQAGVVSSIVIRGNKKIEEDAVRAKLDTKVGQPVTQDNIRQDVQQLFETGYFYNVVVDRQDTRSGVVLTYILTEKPSLAEIVFEGNSEIDDEELSEASGIKPYDILDMSKVRDAKDKISQLYEDKGFFLARIDFEVVPVKEGESSRLVFKVQENEMVKVKQITFIGNNQIPASKLKSFMATQEGGFFSFLSGSGSYKEDAFDRDIQNLNYLYFNEGFVQVKIDRPQVYVTPDKKGILITIRLEEGERFNVGNVDFAGDLLFSEADLREEIEIDDREQFSYEVMQRDLRTLQAKYGDLGYAFANIIPQTRLREKERLIDITYEADKGHKVYIGQINVVGNTKTRDKVIRRELKINEGELYHETRKRESVENVQRLGFFEEVNFNTSTPPDQPDRLNIDIVVKERNTGTIQVGAGYSNYQGFVFTGQVNQINFLGRGQRLGASVNIGGKQDEYNVSFTEPYLLDTEWEAGFDLFKRSLQLTEYNDNETGGAFRVGHPLAPYLRGVIGYKLDYTDIELNTGGDADLYPEDTVDGMTSALTFSLNYDRRNDRFMPSKGIFSSLSLDYAGVGGDLNYTKGHFTFRYYKKIYKELVWRNNLSYGFISSNDENAPPFNELYRLGGANNLRGFNWWTIARRKYSEKAYQEAQSAGDPNPSLAAMVPYGGTQQLYYQLEFQFPLIDEAGIKGVVFYDIGNADDALSLGDFRSDVGLGFRWFSPIGPLRFEWGFPINRKPEYDEDAFQFHFAIGSPF